MYKIIATGLLKGWRDRTQRRSAPVLGRSNVKARISLGKPARLLAVGACCARGRARSVALYPAFLVVIAACWLMLPSGLPAAKAESTFSIGDSNFLLNGKPF